MCLSFTLPEDNTIAFVIALSRVGSFMLAKEGCLSYDCYGYRMGHLLIADSPTPADGFYLRSSITHVHSNIYRPQKFHYVVLC